jgi:DNA-directed RNA polymerase specialized sigma24 family protein
VLQYGADLNARQIAELLIERTNTIEVGLHRALRRLRAVLEGEAPARAGTPSAGSPEKVRQRPDESR